MLISFVVPVCNEADGLEHFYYELLRPELEKLGEEWEVIFVDDGSSDGGLEVLQKFATEEKRVRVVRFSRNFGKEVALTAGLRESGGDAVIMMDADGQQPPKLVHEFIKRWKEGAEIVIGVRGRYEKHGLIAKMGSKVFYWMLGKMGVKNTVPGSTDYRLVDRAVVDEYNKLTEHGRITRGLMDWMGFQREYVDYVYGNRLAGKPSYNFRKLFGLAIDSFVSLSVTPLMLIGVIGGAITVLSFLLGVFVLIEEFLLKDPMGLKWTGTTCLSIFITFLVGMMMVAQAVTALYISHIHAEAQGRPLYIVDKKASRNLRRKKSE